MRHDAVRIAPRTAALLIAMLAAGVGAQPALAPPCQDGKVMFHLVVEEVVLHVEPAGGRGDPGSGLSEVAPAADPLRAWRLLAPLTRALREEPPETTLPRQVRAVLEARGCAVVDSTVTEWKEGDSLARLASATWINWSGTNYDILVLRVVALLTPDARRFVMQTRAMMLRAKGMGQPLRFDLEHRSATIEGATEGERVTRLAADGARRFLELRRAAVDEVVEYALHGPRAAGATVEDPRWKRHGTLVGEHAGRALVRFDGRLVSGPGAAPLGDD